MKRLVLVTFAICTAPLYAHGQDAQPDAAKLKAEARSAVDIIGADRHKTQTYCRILELERQQQALQDNNGNNKKRKKEKDKDKEKAEALLQKINQLHKQLGPESVTIDRVLNQLDLQSPGGREIALIIQGLNESCPY
jgi:oligoendopeptidase F